MAAPPDTAPAAGPVLEAAAAAPRRRRQIPELAALVVMLVALSVFFSVKSPVFLNWDNWQNILTAIAVTGIIAAPGTLLLVAGQLDLSVGSAAAFCGVIVATIGGTHHHLVLGIALAVAAGLCVGVVNGMLVTVVGVNSLITTLGGLAAYRGLTEVLSDAQTISVNGFSGIGTARPFLDIPMPVLILVVVAVLFWLGMRYSVYGRSMYAIGANPLAARLSGIRAGRAIFIGFVLSGLCVALGGMILTSQLSAASPQAASGLELSVVTAIVLGGASLTGGRGTLVGTMLGLLIIGVLNNGLVLLNVSSFWQDVARGVLLILAVSFDQLRVRLSRE